MPHPTVASIIRDHVTLTVDCLDRLYLTGYVPSLQTPGGLVWFLREHLGYPIPSPAVVRPLHDRFVAAVHAFAAAGAIPEVSFVRGQRKDDVAADYRTRHPIDDGVVFIGVAQERAFGFKARKQTGPRGGVFFEWSRQSVAVNHYYFYLQDPEWGPAFIKVGTYLPYPVRICLNGHEWAKQQLRRQGVDFESLDNGFRRCADPAALQATCARLGPDEIRTFFDRWVPRLPWPLTVDDRLAGYRHRLSLKQVEVSCTQVFDRPLQGRHFFEAVIRDNLDLGRPDRVSLLFPGRLTRRTPAPAHGYQTRVLTTGVAPSLHVAFKHTDVKQYFKEGRALRTETTFNDPTDVQRTKGLDTLPQLRATGQRINAQLLEAERLSGPDLLGDDRLARLQQPGRVGRQRIAALRIGDPRVQALAQALCRFAHLPDGFRNRDLRPVVAALFGRTLDTYTAGAMTSDLRRLRRHGLIERIPGSQRYRLTAWGLRVVFFLARLQLRILNPAAGALEPEADVPQALHQALRRLDEAIAALWAASTSPKAA